jgi:hypothetical protein
MFTTWHPMLRALLMTMFWFSVISHGFRALPSGGMLSARSSTVSGCARLISLLRGRDRARGEGARKTTLQARSVERS